MLTALENRGDVSLQNKGQTCLLYSLVKIGDFPDSKESACNAGDTGDSGLLLGLVESPREGNSNLFQYSCLENPMDREAWWVLCSIILQSMGSQELNTTESLSMHALIKIMFLSETKGRDAYCPLQKIQTP